MPAALPPGGGTGTLAQGPRQREQALWTQASCGFLYAPPGSRGCPLDQSVHVLCFLLTCYTSPDLRLIGGWVFIPAWALLLPESGLETQPELLILF